MKLRHLFLTGLFVYGSMATTWAYSRLAVQGALATGGTLGIGLVNFTEWSELGFTVSGKVNNASQQTKLISPVLFAGLRKSLCECTDFAYGLDLVNNIGRVDGQKINSDYQIGPYISLEQMFTRHLMLVGWIEPYSYGYEKKAGRSTSTNNFFATGGLAINYLF